MCATAIANLMQQSASEGNHRNMFSKDKVSLNLVLNIIYPLISFFFLYVLLKYSKVYVTMICVLHFKKMN